MEGIRVLPLDNPFDLWELMQRLQGSFLWHTSQLLDQCFVYLLGGAWCPHLQLGEGHPDGTFSDVFRTHLSEKGFSNVDLVVSLGDIFLLDDALFVLHETW